MKNKKIALLLAIIMASTVALTACASDDTSTPDSTPSTATDGASKSDTPAADGERKMEGNMYVEGLPIVKEKETFSLFCDNGGKADELVMYPILEEQTNVKVDLMLYPYEIAKEKLNILINSGKYPDAVGGWLLLEDNILKDGMKEGLYIPIGDKIEKYAPKMTEVLNIEGVRDIMTLPDGNIYTIPYVTGEPEVLFLPWINTEWLEKVGMKMPTTTDELTAVLKAFKEKDPNGNGKADEIPFTADKDNLNLGLISGWWGASVPQTGIKNFAMVDGKLDFQANKEGYKESIKYLRELYTQGLIDPEIFTQDKSQWKAKGVQGLYGCSISYGSGDFHEGLKPGERTKYDPLPPLKTPTNDKPIYRRGSYGYTVFKTQLAITDTAKNPDTIIRWYDNVFQPDNSAQCRAGLFGKRLEKLGELDYRYLDENLLTEAERLQYGWGNMFTQSLPTFLPLDLKFKQAEGVPEPYDEKKYANEVYKPYLDEMPANVWVSAEDSKRIATLSVSIEQYVDQKRAVWISNQADIDKEWDGYIAQLDKLGLQELIDIRVKAQESAPK